jgi:hypothetical protein
MDAGNKAPTVGALGDAGAVAERVGERRINCRELNKFSQILLSQTLQISASIAIQPS